MMTSALKVASYVNSRVRIAPYDTKKLQKLIYFCQAWHVAWTGRKLFSEPFEAWPDGPVVRPVFGYQNNEGIPVYDGTGLTTEEIAIIDSVLEHYGQLSYQELIDLSHAHAPWAEVREGLSASESSRRLLKDSTIASFYTGLAIADEESPKRKVEVERAELDQALEVGRQSSMDWREALDLLATQ
jgi:uncharacterized phage-associated protein